MHFKTSNFQTTHSLDLKEGRRFAKQFCDVYKSNYKLAEIL